MTSLPPELVAYLIKRDQQRTQEIEQTWDTLQAGTAALWEHHFGPETAARLAWEMAVLGFVAGAQHASGRAHHQWQQDFPKDRAIVHEVLHVGAQTPERFPALRAMQRAASGLSDEEDGDG